MAESVYRIYYPDSGRASGDYDPDPANAFKIVADAVQKSEEGETKAIIQRKRDNGSWEDRIIAEIPKDKMDREAGKALMRMVNG